MPSLYSLVFAILAQAQLIEIPELGDSLTPQPPKLIEGLPSPEVLGDGTYLPSPLDDAVSELLGYCTNIYPLVCKSAIDATRKAEVKICEQKQTLTTAINEQHQIEEQSKMSNGIPAWLAATLAASSAAIGVVVGVTVANITR